MITIILIALFGTVGIIYYTDYHHNRRMLSQASSTYSTYRSNSVRNPHDRSIYNDDDDDDNGVLDALTTAAILNESLSDDDRDALEDALETAIKENGPEKNAYHVQDDTQEHVSVSVGDNSRFSKSDRVVDETPIVDDTSAPSWNSPSINPDPTPSTPSYELPSSPAPSYSPPTYEAPTYGGGGGYDSDSGGGSSDSGSSSSDD